MPYTKEIPQWNAAGTKPPQSLIDTGWQFNQKPPADYFNWQWHNVYQVLNELHQFALHTEKLGAANGVATLGSNSKLTASQLPAIGSAQITDGSITNNVLATDVKVGSLAALTTTTKSNVVAAVNEVKTNNDSHSADSVRHVTQTDKNTWNAKAETTVATTSANGLMSSADKTKLDGVAANANNYSHPSTHPATMIVEDGSHRFVTDAQISSWDGKAETTVASTTANGLMSSSDKTKLNGIATNANNYSHPTGDGNLHVPATGTTNNGKFLKAGSTAGSLSWQTILAGDVSGLQALLDAKADSGHGHAVATTGANGFMSSSDKSKLDGIATGAQTNQNAFSNVKVGTTTVAADSATDTLELIAGTNIGLAANATNDSVTISNTTPNATTSTSGLMSNTDKSKLDGIASGANNYTHPSTHPATMIVEDSDHRFATDVEKNKWNGAYDTIGDHTADGSIHLGSSEKIAVTELQNVSVSGWTTATLLNGWSTKFDRTPRFRRVGNMVQLSGGVGGGTTGDGTSVFVLPVGMRPSRTVIVPIIAAGVGAILNGNALINRLVVSTGGNVTFSYGWNPEGWAIDVIIPL